MIPSLTSPATRTIRALFSGRQALILAALVAFFLFGLLWTRSIKQNHLNEGQRSWIPAANWLGVDFLNNYHASRHWWAGGNPYDEPFGDPLGRPFFYSPVLLLIFSWCCYLSPWAAVLTWMAALTVMAAVAALACWKARNGLGAWPLPVIFVLAAVLCSTPILFALERGNCDMLALMLLLGTCWMLHRRGILADVLAGGCVALATWIKIYPCFLVLGLLAARRPRAVVCMIVAFAAIGMADYPDTLHYIKILRSVAGTYDISFHASAHPMSTYWKHFWEGTRFQWLNRIPGTVATACALLPGALWVSWRMFRCRNKARLLYPYFAWLTATGTFFPQIANDYNLFFLCIAALAVWDRRDPVVVHLLMAPLLLWWQPVHLPIGPDLLFVFKLVGLAGVGLSLLGRIREQGELAVVEETRGSGEPPRVWAAAA